VVELNGAGVRLWHTFVGSVADEWLIDIAVSESATVYVKGNSQESWGNPTNAYAGNTDVFILANPGHLPPNQQSYTITLQNGVTGYNGAVDTWIDEWRPTQNFNSGSEINFLRVHTDGHQNSLVQVDLPPVLVGSLIQSADLELVISSRNKTYPLLLDVFRLTRAWDEDEATWGLASSGDAWEGAGATGIGDRSSISSGTILLNDDAFTPVSTGITSLVQYWVDHPAENHGLILQGRGGGGVQYALRSSDHPEPTDRPKLVIQYWPPTPEPTTTSTATATPTETSTTTPTSLPTATVTTTATPSVTATATPALGSVVLPLLLRFGE